VLFPRKEGKAKVGMVDDTVDDNIEGLAGEQVTDKGVFVVEKPAKKVDSC